MRIGCIGVGAHATNNLYPNFEAAGLKLVATCARHMDRAQAAARRWGAAHAFDEPRRMLESVDLDAVVVCVAPSDYAALVTMCLQGGKPVFCDKPGASTAEQGRELAKLSASTGVPVVVGYMKRFAPAYRRAAQITREPGFGPMSLGSFTFVMGQGFGGDLRTYLIDNPVHHLDLARYFLGEIDELDAYITELPGFGHAVAAIGRAASGAVATFQLSTTASWNQRNEHAEVFGKGNAVWIDNVDVCTYRPSEGPEQTWRPNYTVPLPRNSGPTTMGFVPELEHFRRVVTEGIENESDMASAAATLALAERLCAIAGV